MERTILATTDEGKTWNTQTPTQNPMTNLSSISCPSTTTCYAVGEEGTILATTDGGDSIPPESPTITGKPSNPSTDHNPSFEWTGAEPGGSFACRLDTPSGNGSFATCTSPKIYSGLVDGLHTFHVLQIDEAGNAGADSTYTWTIASGDSIPPEPPTITTKPSNPSTDHTEPQTEITSAPKKTRDTTPTIRFSSSEPGSTFQCKVDRGAFKACRSPATLRSLSIGKHKVSVRAADADGNVDPTPAKKAIKIIRTTRRRASSSGS